MIDGLHRRNGVHQIRLMAVDVLHELGLRIGRACDEDRARLCDRLGDRVKESVILSGVSAADAVRLVVDMSGWMLGVKDQLVDFRRTKIKHARLMMIDPDHRMKMLAHKIAPGWFGATIGVPGGAQKQARSTSLQEKFLAGFRAKGLSHHLGVCSLLLMLRHSDSDLMATVAGSLILRPNRCVRTGAPVVEHDTYV